MFDPAWIGSTTPEPHHGTSYHNVRAAKDNDLLEEPSGNVYNGLTKRRRLLPSRRRAIERPKRSKLVDRRASSSVHHAATAYSSMSEIGLADPRTLRTDMLERRDVKRERYGKRPRHRTKPDKYDLKIDSKSRHAGKADVGKKRSSKRRRKESGLVIDNEFKAPNVAQERLTLKSNGGPGMFHNGKVSCPVQRRGLPDLAFSEMKFLSKQPNHDEAMQRESKDKKVASQKKEKERTQQIAEYFERSRADERCTQHLAEASRLHQSTANKLLDSPLRADQHDTHSKERQLRQQNHGLQCHSVPRKDHLSDLAEQPSVPAIEQSRQEHDGSDPKFEAHCLPNRRSISQYSWSITPPRSGLNPKEPVEMATRKSPETAAAGSQCLNKRGCNKDEKHSDVMYHKHCETESAQEFSVSQTSLDQYTKSILLGAEHHVWNLLPVQPITTEFYTLADLKHLSRLEQLDGDPKESLASRNEHWCRHSSSGKRHLNPRFAQVNTHRSDTRTKRKELCESALVTSNRDQRQFMPETSLLMSVMQTNDYPIQHVASSAESKDHPQVPHRVLLGHLDHYGSLDHGIPRPKVMPMQNRVHASLKPRYSPSPTTGVPFLAISQPDSQRCARNANVECSNHHRSDMNIAQQIIYDIEQEERLANRSSNHRNKPVDDLADIAMEGLADQTKVSPTCDPPSGSFNLLADEETLLFKPGGDLTLRQDAIRSDSRADQCQRYSAEDASIIDRDLHDVVVDKFVSATHLHDQRHRHPQYGRSNLLKQEATHQIGEIGSANFWRPHLLY